MTPNVDTPAARKEIAATGVMTDPGTGIGFGTETGTGAGTVTPTVYAAAFTAPDSVLDACGLCCPGPLIQVKMSMDPLLDGQVLKVTASDPGFYEDIKAWARMSNNTLLQLTKLPTGMIEAYLRKGVIETSASAPTEAGAQVIQTSNASTMVVFSGDLDKAIASFIIANGAASSGKKVTMFFTFWGLNIIRKDEKVPVNKNFIGKMFGAMMPRGSRKADAFKYEHDGHGLEDDPLSNEEQKYLFLGGIDSDGYRPRCGNRRLPNVHGSYGHHS